MNVPTLHGKPHRPAVGHRARRIEVVDIGGGIANVPSSGAATIDPQVEQRLWALAARAATTNGSTVKNAQAVRSTHAHAVQVTMQDVVEGDQAVPSSRRRRNDVSKSGQRA
jgi:hypothetical protein